MNEGYLLMWHESGDEIHIDLITKEDYDKFCNAKNIDEEMNINYEPIEHWFIQTGCIESWKFGDYKILGTYCTMR